MRLKVLASLLLVAANLPAQDESKLAKRYTYDVNEKAFPQDTPVDALKSAVKAIAGGKVDYMMAHLVDPEYVDAKVERYKEFAQGKKDAKANAAFRRLVKETEQHFLEDPELVQQLKRFIKEGEWKMEKGGAMASLKDLVGQHVFMKQIGKRWFLENRQQ